MRLLEHFGRMVAAIDNPREAVPSGALENMPRLSRERPVGNPKSDCGATRP